MRRLTQFTPPHAHSTRRLFSGLPDSSSQLIAPLITNGDWSRLKPIVESIGPSEFLHHLFEYPNYNSLRIASFVKWSHHHFKVLYSVEYYAKLFVSLVSDRRASTIGPIMNFFAKQQDPKSLSSFSNAILATGDSLCDCSVVFDMFLLESVYIGKLDVALEGFRRAGEYGFKLSVVSCNSLLTALAREPRLGDVEFVYKEITSRRIRPTRVTLEMVVRGLSKSLELDLMENIVNRVDSVIEDMKLYQIVPDVITFNIMLDVYCKSNNPENLYKARALFEEMKRKGVKLDVIVFGTLINGFCSLGKFDEAMHVVGDMNANRIVPNVFTYSALISCCCKMDVPGRMCKAFALFKEMMERGIRPNVVIYTTLIDGYCKNDNMVAAMKLFKKMKRQGMRPDVTIYNSLVNGFCSLGKFDEAMHLMEDMNAYGVVPDVVTYTTFINGYSKMGGLQRMCKAFALYKEMVENGISANVITFNALIDGYFKNGNLVDVVKVYKEMIRQGVKPNVITYTTLIDRYCKNDHLLAAVEVFKEIKRQDLKPNVITYTVLINAFCSKGKIEVGMKLRNEMLEFGLEPNMITYSILIKGFLKSKMLKEARDLFNDIVKRGLAVNVMPFNSLIDAYFKAGQMKEACAIFDLMLEKGVSPNDLTFKILNEMKEELKY